MRKREVYSENKEYVCEWEREKTEKCSKLSLLSQQLLSAGVSAQRAYFIYDLFSFLSFASHVFSSSWAVPRAQAGTRYLWGFSTSFPPTPTSIPLSGRLKKCSPLVLPIETSIFLSRSKHSHLIPSHHSSHFSSSC